MKYLRNNPRLLLLFTVFFLSSCQTINRSSEALGIPPYTVILSFDDGPNAHSDTTARLLDVLKKYEIHALFSLLGENAEAYPELVRRIHDEGHYIVNHGYSDKFARRMRDEEFRNNLIIGEKAISAALGEELFPKLYRPHGGFYSSRQKGICSEEGYTLFLSSVRVHDAVLSEAKQGRVVREIIEKIEENNGGIILLHDDRDSHFRKEKKLEKNLRGAYDRSWIPQAVEEIIIALLEKGYTFNSSLDQILKY